MVIEVIGMGQSAQAMEIVARVDFRTLDEFEAGFYDRIGADAVFLARHHIVTPSQEVPVGTRVRLVISLPTGAQALRVDGTVAWMYPRDHVPPGREAGLGVTLEPADGDDAERIVRMRRRPGAGARVRSPGSRLLASAVRLPRTGTPFASLTVGAAPVVGASTAPSLAVTAPLPASPASPPPANAAHPPAPAPRLMGLLVDQTFDPTPAPQPRLSTFESEPPRPLPRQLSAADEPPPPIAGLPDAPAHQPAGAFDERRTDVDLLQSLASVDLLTVDADDARALVSSSPPGAAAPPRLGPGTSTPRGRATASLADELLPTAPPPTAPPPTAPSPTALSPTALSPTALSLTALPSAAAADADPTGSFKVEELPSAEAELVMEMNPALLEETLGGDALEPVTAEAESVSPSVSSQEWELLTEHGVNDVSTAEATSTPDGDGSAISVLPRPLPRPDPWPPLPPIQTTPMGTAFLMSGRRTQEVSLIETFAWPLGTTKRVGKLDLHRESESPEPPPPTLGAAAGANPALEEPTVDGFERGATDPRLSVGGVLERVEKALAQAARDADEIPPPLAVGDADDTDSVFSTSTPVRPAMAVPPRTPGEGDAPTRDDLKRPSAAFHDDDADTDLDMVRPKLGGRLSRR